MTDQNSAPARRVSRTGGIEWPRHRKPVDVNMPGGIERVVGASKERLQPDRVFARLLQESNANIMRTRPQWKPNLGSRFRRIRRQRDVFQRCLEILVTAE